MLELVSYHPRKLASNFVEEAGIRCFETNEFKDWYQAIRAVLLESGVNISSEIIRDLFLSLPDSSDDEIFDLTLKSYLIGEKLLTEGQVEGEDWKLLFLPHSDPALGARLNAVHEQIEERLSA